MATFSQRMGFTPVRVSIQKDFADDELRNFLWNALEVFYWKGSRDYIYKLHQGNNTMYTRIWVKHYKSRLDEMPDNSYNIIEQLKSDFIGGHWYEVYDILEFVAGNYPSAPGAYKNAHNDKFMAFVNDGLKDHLSAYRFVDGLITEITSEQEIASIEDALESTSALTGVQTHLRRSLELLTDRKTPDYRNSVKESISAIESLAKMISGNEKDSLAGAIDKIKGKIKIHKALEQGFKNIYGYTSDDSGIRHALIEQSNCDFEDAKFMLVSCSAFVNYLIIKAGKAGIEI